MSGSQTLVSLNNELASNNQEDETAGGAPPRSLANPRIHWAPERTSTDLWHVPQSGLQRKFRPKFGQKVG